MAEKYYLEVVDRETGAESRYAIEQLPCTIGRGRGVDLAISLDQVSRQHARLEGGAAGLTIEDLGSTNGTFVNHERISSSPVAINPGDRIHLGTHEFVLGEAGSGTQTPGSTPRTASATAGHTILGFTAEPTGFPVQAPQFYELLNDEALTIHAQPVMDHKDRTRAWTLKAASRHPDLDARHDELQHLAGQLGEEARLNQIIRQQALRAAEDNALDDQPLIVTVHPNELEDIDLLEDELQALSREYGRAQLVLEIKAGDTEARLLDGLATVAHKLDILLALTGFDQMDDELLNEISDHADWLVIDSHTGAERLKSLAGNPDMRRVQLIADRVDDGHGLELMRDLADVWVRGRAVGESTLLKIQG
jgi:pSer/pThr/pTyr-binding forkhead associated (FHA) protein